MEINFNHKTANERNTRTDVKECANFMVCYNCVSYSPFLIYMESNKMDLYRSMPTGIHLYCPICSPEPAHFAKWYPNEGRLLAEDSILNDRHLLDALSEFVYKNPYYKLFGPSERVIITEKTKLLSTYKKIAKQPAPLTRKLSRFIKLFPKANLMPNLKYTNESNMCQAVKQKYKSIIDSSMALSSSETCELYDMFDTMACEQTPRIHRQEKQIQRAKPPLLSPIVEDVIHTRKEPFGSTASATTFILPPEKTDCLRSENVSSLEINISSQSVTESVDIGSFSTMSSLDVNISSQTAPSQPPIIEQESPRVLSVGRKRPPTSQPDYEQPGPSGLHHKRVRFDETPTNPDPSTYHLSPQGDRLPRLGGG
ncbi:uncharacterized protein LOC131440371 [Malaya genurostris]|uniref:uncharacterized protein LOC131440371 n=1 Tax=Malaya genurostris TaxID=325434 RepID=UPI0026F3D236|nr:uncharacterized protein LOC131440371 [Malaya genurostris]